MCIDSPRAGVSAGAGIRILQPEDVDQLRFGFWSRSSNDEVKRTIERYPGRSVWLPESLEYAIVGPWRHRDEIANVQELSAVRHPSEMLDAVVQRCDALEANVVVSVEIDERREPAFYRRADFRMLEEVVTYELDVRDFVEGASPEVEFRLGDPSVAEDMNLLRELDHACFPWLWWNSDREFLVYGEAPGVELHVASAGDRPIGYIGITAYLGWGHLDRIAVLPDAQGAGFGRAMLAYAVQRLIVAGARKVGLSTQRDNMRSQRLYEAAGFRRSLSNDYRLYAKILRMPDGIDDITRT